ncbi:MAG: PTS system mannose/fructose/N-acetylgalactosamine-transporter subunit IIB [Candidatus Spyradocola sp.]
MRNIVLTRVDERLIHGQVMTSWLKLCCANVVLIIDQASATNAFLRRILFAAAPKDVELLVMTEADAAAYLKEDSPVGEKVLVLTKTPQPLLAMIQSGVALEEVILGNMGGGPGRKRFNKSISATAEEIQTFRDIIAQGVSVYCQMVPSDSKEDVKKLLK